MYLHLGQGVVVSYRDLIGIFDLDNTSYSHLTRAFLKRAEQAGEVMAVGEDLPKSIVICARKGKGRRVYLSQMAPATLLRRVENDSME